MASPLYNVDHEKQFLSAAIRNPLLLAEVKIDAADFSAVNRDVFEAVRQTAASAGAGYSKFLLIERLNALGAKIGGVLDPKVYIDALDLLNVSDKAALGVAREIKRTSIRRELNSIGRKIVATTDKDDHKKAAELVAEVTGVFNDHINIIEGGQEHEPVDLYGTIGDFLGRDNSVSTKAIPMPFPIMNDLWGYMDIGSCYLYCSRMKIGKSSWWLSVGQQLAAQDKDDSLRILVLDTELELWENQSRSLAQISGVNEFRIRQGWYRQRQDELKKVEAAAAHLEPLRQRVHHCFCGGLSLENLASICRRWAHKNLSPGKRGLIVYDYIKLGGADFKSKQPLFVQTGEKMEVFKNLSKELRVPVMCFAQTNRENVDSKAGERQENSAVIGGSDMLAQFASNIYLLSELSPDERAQLGQLNPDDATHSLREIACRQRGPNELGEGKLVKYKVKGKDRYTRNFLLFNFTNFAVKEVGSFRQVVDRGQLVVDVQGNPGASSGPLL